MSKQRRSTLRPPPSQEARNASGHLVADLLRRKHRLEVPTSYLVIVEGTTDVHYLNKAAGLAKVMYGVDLLDLGPCAPDGGSSMTVCTPITRTTRMDFEAGCHRLSGWRLTSEASLSSMSFLARSALCLIMTATESLFARRLREQGFNMDRLAQRHLTHSSIPLCAEAVVASRKRSLRTCCLCAFRRSS